MLAPQVHTHSTTYRTDTLSSLVVRTATTRAQWSCSLVPDCYRLAASRLGRLDRHVTWDIHLVHVYDNQSVCEDTGEVCGRRRTCGCALVDDLHGRRRLSAEERERALDEDAREAHHRGSLPAPNSCKYTAVESLSTRSSFCSFAPLQCAAVRAVARHHALPAAV